MPLGTEYTDGETIDNAVITGGNPVYTDQFMSSDRDLVVGLGRSGQDIRTGRGDDFVHSGNGNDTVDLGRGNDKAWLGSGDDIVITGRGSDQVAGEAGFDTVDYTDRFSNFSMPLMSSDGLTVTINGASSEIRIGTDIDTLTDIENILGSSRDDVFNVEAVSGNMYINGGQGADILEVSGSIAGAYILDTSDGVYPPGHELAGQTYNGTITDGTNTLYYTDIADDAVTGISSYEPIIPPISTDLGGQERDAIELPLEAAIEILRNETDDAIAFERTMTPDNGISLEATLKSSVPVSVMQTLMENDQSSISVSQTAMNGNAHDRVREVLRGSVERLNEIDKTQEAEAHFDNQINHNAEEAYAQETNRPANYVEYESEVIYDL